MKRICTICARGGSKGVPGKNLRVIAGRPLLAWSIWQAAQTGLFDAIAVSSDSEDILRAAEAAGAQVLVRRPADMATDTAPKAPVIRHALLAAEAELGWQADVLVDLDATSPLREPADIAGAVAQLEADGRSCVITAAPARRSPYFNLVELDGAGNAHLSKPLPNAVVRRQDAPRCFDMNASIYVWRRSAIVGDPRVFYPDTGLYEMPEERSVDIDSPLDMDIVTMLMERRHGERPA
ncbi:posttranslational modification protein [Alsobacter metallidurans]|uniref:Posttranslational modification protein n=1 Tax=Alsobacter metallidurans TaxID=340221 RepID=A0A917MJ61_9HYPH|nr:acylneuraminate cytidylyltransferase family protein [Alsobacter metallidurans]GGH15568.1 posttranslational modification protein [Alsobacter metallidurans]